ncbi:uncharacterized protein [Pseudorasbora parva]|uniref:uncharacterized protein n=1 Tax=Pseudorasbora parva TaxID=51549 RepID=UPI00351E3F98
MLKPPSTSASMLKPPSTSASMLKPPSTSAPMLKPPSTSASVPKPPSTSASVPKPPPPTMENVSGLRTVRKVVKQSFKTITNKVCSLVKRSRTFRRESAAATDPLETEPMRDDAQPSASGSVPTPPPPTMQNLSACFITLGEFIRKKGSSMKEKDARVIMRRIFVALKDFWELGVYLPINVEGIAIDPNTLQIKITDSSQTLMKPSEKMTGRDQALADAWFKRCAKLKHSESYFKVMYALVKDINPPFWKRRLSKECSNLLRRLETQRGLQLLTTLQNILNDPWFTVNQPMIAGSGSFGAGFTKIILRKGQF